MSDVGRTLLAGLEGSGSDVVTPDQPSVFHITHVDNLASVAERGLLCDNAVAEVALDFRGIAYVGLKADRAAKQVDCGPGGTLADYVPFYFAPRSPMLYTIYRGNVPGAEGQHPYIVHLRFDLQELFEAQPCVFTNGHAVIEMSDFFEDLDGLDQVPWGVMEERYWSQDGTGEMRRQRQAEFLAWAHVPWEMVLEIGVMNATCKALAEEAIAGVAHQPPVVIRRDWYY